MDNNEKLEESIRFVARHYRAGAFSTPKAWHRLGIAPVAARRFRPGRGLKWAAAAVGAVALTASAIFLANRYASVPAPAPEAAPKPQAAPISSTLRFNDTPLSEVVDMIERTYGVKVTNVPAEDYRLTGVYEGTADDIVATINDLLGTNLEIEK